MTKTTCPITRAQFVAGAKMAKVEVAGQTLLAMPKEFSTGSVGFYGNGKVTIEVGGVPVQFQVSITLTAIGSKELPKESAVA